MCISARRPPSAARASPCRTAPRPTTWRGWMQCSLPPVPTIWRVWATFCMRAAAPVWPCHHPQAVAGHTVLAGRLHPTLRLRGPARDALRAPCFGWGDGQLILPAFGAFTGTAPEALPAHWAQFAVLPGRVVAVPGGKL